jgi:phosphatidylglycerophosphate synthase
MSLSALRHNSPRFHRLCIGTGIRVPVMGNPSPEMNEKNALLRAAARSDDGFFSTFVLRKISRLFTSALVETRIKPNTVTIISMVFGLLAAYIASQGKYLVSGIALLFSLVLDCVDGEVARYKKEFSKLGAWLDALSDRVKEYAYIAGLIYSAKDESAWWLGIAVVILQTMRHLSDYNFVRLQNLYEGERITHGRSGVVYWTKKIIHLPIGERWLLLAILPLTLSIQNLLVVVLYLGIISFSYVILGRARRVTRWPSKSVDGNFLIRQRDTLLPIPISASQISWTIPSLLRLLECVALLVIPLDIPASLYFLLITSVALWHYTNLYDALDDRTPILGRAGLRLLGRVGVVFLAYLLGFDYQIAIVLAIYLLILILFRGGHNVRKEEP